MHGPLGANFSGAPIGSLLFIEVCAGCARLSQTMAAKGFKVMAVDQKSNRHKQLFPTISIDLADDEAVQYLISLLTKPGAVFYLHCAPPCGTASRARERRLSFALRKRGVKEPKPLRSSSHPHGLPHLQGVELRRVTTANSVYRNVAAICRAALKAGCYVSIENPSRSYMWETEWMLSLIAEFQLQEIKFQQCMWGSERDKWTSFFSSCQWLSFLAVSCDGSHSHAAWGVTFQDGGYSFNTAQEAEYPHKLCLAIANAAYDHALKSGCFVANKKTKLNNGLPSSMSAAAGRQPRGNKCPEIIPEFDFTMECRWTLPPPRKTPRMLTSDELQTLQLQAPSKILSYLPSGDATDESKTPSAKIGVYRTCDKFMEEAIKLKHPFDDSSSIDEQLKQNIFDLMTLGCDEVARRRQLTIDYYASRKAELSEAEAVIHGALHPRRRRLVEDKAFILFREMCVDAGIDDPELCDLLVNGTPLVGKSGSSNLFEAEDNIPAMSDVQLMKSSRWSRKMLSGRKTHGAADPHVEAEIWKGALEESEKGWLCGPMTEQEVIDKYGPLFVASPRFGLQQTDKVRPIDDMSVSLVNSSFSASYKLSLDGVDGISILSRTFLEAVSEDRQVCIPMSGGCYLKGVLHPSLTVDDARNLFGRTLDLEAAYKQMLVRESSLWASILLINEPGVGGRFFASEVLPFGASASVYSFNRVSRAIHTIGARLFSLIWACYYDDFPQVDIGKSGGNEQVIAEKLLDLIGWRYSRKESKRQPFCKTFSALGVVFDFSLANEKKIVVRNKDSRVDQVCSEIDKILECGSFSTPSSCLAYESLPC